MQLPPRISYESRDTLNSFCLFITVQAITKLNLGHRNKFEIEFQKIGRRSSRSPHNAEFGYFTLLFCMQRTAKKCTKSYNARAHLLFCSLNLLFSDVAVAVAVAVFLNSLINLCFRRRLKSFAEDQSKVK